jgi:tetratricopeptide (TPR) repeat protein
MILLFCGLPLSGQYREYYLSGQIQDIRNLPLEGVEINLFDTSNSISFSEKTNKEGKFKFVGLPHGIYQVTISKEGFESKKLEWKFEAPQDKMLKVEIPAILLASGLEIQQMEQNQQLKKDIEAATEKIRNQDYDGALDILKKALQSDAKNVNLLYLAGLSYAKKKMYAEAREMLAIVTTSTPDFTPAHFQLGVCLQQLGEKEKALEQYREVIRLDPKNLDNYFNAALILVEMNKTADALAYCSIILETRPDDPDVNEIAGQCQLQLGDYPKALALFEKAVAFSRDEDKKKIMNELIAELRKTIKQK